MANTMQNISALFSNMRTRTILLSTVGILFLVIIVGFLGFKRSKNTENNTASLETVQGIRSIPGAVPSTPEYAQMQQNLNDQNYQQALATQGTSIPTVIGKQPVQGQLAGAGITFPGTPTPTVTSTTTTVTDTGSPEITAQQEQLNDLQQQVAQLTDQQLAAQEQKIQEAMQQETQQLLASWAGKGGTSLQQYVTRKEQNGVNGQVITTTTGSGDVIATSSVQTSAPASAPVIKAGDIIFAVLNTEVNSDEPGPILATVVGGPLKGAKLVGSLQQAQQLPGTNGPTKVTLSFNTLNIPNVQNSLGISAVAIDADTARTAIASNVDHHYLSRYGSVFAAAFLQGYGQAVQQSGSTQVNSIFGGTTTTYQDLSPKQEIAAAFGQVGETWGNNLTDAVNRPNTIIVHSGLGLGILFLSDVTLDQLASNPAGNLGTLVTSAAAPAVTTTTTTLPNTAVSHTMVEPTVQTEVSY